MNSTSDTSKTFKSQLHQKQQMSSDKKRSRSHSHDGPPEPFVNLPFYGEHKRAISSVKLAPHRLTKHRNNGTGAICASASADGTVKIWDLLSSKKSSANSNDNSCTPDQSGDDRMSSNGKRLLEPETTLLGHSRGINDVAWSSDAPMVATASDDKSLRLWDAVTGDALVEFRGHDNFVFCTQIYQNLLASGSFDETVKLWDVRSGECVSTLPVHSDPVTAVSFNRDGTCLVSASHDGLIRIWDVQTSECLKTIYASGMFSMKIMYLSEYIDKLKMLLHLTGSKQSFFSFHMTGNPPVSHVTYSPNGKYILAGTLDSKLRLWNVGQRGSNKCTKTYESPNNHVNNKYCIVSDFLVARQDRQCIVTGSETGHVLLYDIQSRKVHQVLGEGVHTDAVLAVDAHDKHELIASGGMTKDKTVQFWAPQSSPLNSNSSGMALPSESPDDGKCAKLI